MTMHVLSSFPRAGTELAQGLEWLWSVKVNTLGTSSLLMSLYILTGSQKFGLGFDNEASVYDHENEISK